MSITMAKIKINMTKNEEGYTNQSKDDCLNIQAEI